MPGTRAKALDERILALLGDGSLRLELLLEGLGDASRRTVQRRIQRLMEQGWVQAEGETRARRYRLLGQAPSPIPLSSMAEALRAYVRQPLQARAPNAYDEALLLAYQPNVSHYLSREVRDQLRAMGTPEAGPRPAGTYARAILDRLLIDLSWASSRLEGNTYSRLDTQNLIELGQAADGKARTEAQMILNHKAAIELLVDNAETLSIDAHTLFNLHALLADDLLADPSEAGRLRRRGVLISGSVFQPLGIPQKIEEHFRILLEKAEAIRDPFEQALFLMVHLPYLQPFIDVNKRVSRVSANIPFIRQNLCPLSFVDVPEALYLEATLAVYERQQTELLAEVFAWAYQRSCARYGAIQRVVAEPDPFRQRHRTALYELVAEIVRRGAGPTAANVTALAATLVGTADVAALSDAALVELERLHEGNVSRYRLRLSEFLAWRAAHPLTGQR